MGTVVNSYLLQVDGGQLTIAGQLFNNPGAVDLISGVLYISSAGAAAGAFRVREGAELRFAATTYVLTVTSMVWGEGTVSFLAGSTQIGGTFDVELTAIADGTAVFNMPVALPKLILGGQNGGILTGAAPVVVTEEMVWAKGTMTGGAATIIAPGATLILSNQDQPSPKYLGSSSSSRTLINRPNAQILWYSGDFVISGTSIFQNEGTMYLYGSDKLLTPNSSQPETFLNTGAIIKQIHDEGAEDDQDTTTFYGNRTNLSTSSYFELIDNRGQITVDVGTLEVQVGQNRGGQFKIAQEASLVLTTRFDFAPQLARQMPSLINLRALW